MQESLAKSLKKTVHLLKEEHDSLSQQRSELKQDQEDWAKREAELKALYAGTENIVDLNVGGQHITTLRSTLTKDRKSMLAAMFSGRHKISTDHKGRACLDRDPRVFLLLLNYLRTDSVDHVLGNDMRLLQNEMAYFQVSYRAVWHAPFVVTAGQLSERCISSSLYAAVTDGNYLTGVCSHSSGITCMFDQEVTLTEVKIAAYFGDTYKWSSSTGRGAAIEYLDSASRSWKKVGILPDTFGDQPEVHTITWQPQSSTTWRLYNGSSVGVSMLRWA
eukprot:TRINITY_DN707_c0_g1_i2.p1 TRINITY_DN707_c0_g1~~TRINITY_DN707_c0_g1_i2.p1  ORF type:complete len:275 (-),score=29.44 TRINITY_DN707_c0_g1_i2:76-900(-)